MAPPQPRLTLTFQTVDVFTQTPYKGNPLAIVHVPRSATHDLTYEKKGKIAKEFNLSETIFIHESERDGDGDGGVLDRKVDIFIPTGVELPFAGHPTIGILVHIGQTHITGPDPKPITLHEKCGIINATYTPATQTALASIPHNVKIHKPATAVQIAVLQPSLSSYWNAHSNRSYPLVSPVKGMAFALIDLESVEDLGKGAPQNQSMQEIHDLCIEEDWKPSFMGAYYFVALGAEVDGDGVHRLKVRSRMFCYDVPEDPATGSAACTLAGYLSKERRRPGSENAPWKKFTEGESAGQTKYRYDVVQGFEMGRESTITVDVVMKSAEGGDIDQILLQGQAVKVMEGKLTI